MFYTVIYIYISIFSKLGFVDLSKRCTLVYLRKMASCINLQLPNVILRKSIFFDMIIIKRTCISIFSKISLVDQSKPCTQIYLQKNRKLHKIATTNSNFEKINYVRHASLSNVHICQFSAKSG